MSYDIWPGIGFEPVDWAKFFAAAGQSAKSTKAVEKRRATGTDFSTFLGISKKSDESVRTRRRLKPRKPGTLRPGQAYGPAPGSTMDPTSDAGRIRELLSDGRPRTRSELALAVGVPTQHIAGLTKTDIKHGRIVRIVKEGELQRFALGEGWDD